MPESVDTLTVRLLTPADALPYRELRLRGLREHPSAFTSGADEEQAKPLAWSEQRLTPSPDKPHDFFFGAFNAAGELVGTAGLQGGYRPKERHYATLVGMMVAAGQGGRGIGAALMRALLAHCRTLPDLQRLNLTVTVGNGTAIRLYERFGFTAWGVLPAAIRVDGVDHGKLHMALDLSALA